MHDAADSMLERQEALRLVHGMAVGRIVFTLGAMPAVRPVNYALVDDDVVFRTAVGSPLATAVHGAVVAFEVDEISPAHRRGWSVTITGVALEVRDPSERLRLAVGIPPLGDHGPSAGVVRISTGLVSGRFLDDGPVRLAPDPTG